METWPSRPQLPPQFQSSPEGRGGWFIWWGILEQPSLKPPRSKGAPVLGLFHKETPRRLWERGEATVRKDTPDAQWMSLSPSLQQLQIGSPKAGVSIWHRTFKKTDLWNVLVQKALSRSFQSPFGCIYNKLPWCKEWNDTGLKASWKIWATQLSTCVFCFNRYLLRTYYA